MMYYNNFGWGMGFGAGIFGWLLMIVFWGAIIWLIVWLISQNLHNETHKNQRDPKMILKSRYARGEITTKEYHEMKKELDDDALI